MKLIDRFARWLYDRIGRNEGLLATAERTENPLVVREGEFVRRVYAGDINFREVIRTKLREEIFTVRGDYYGRNVYSNVYGRNRLQELLNFQAQTK